MAWTSRLAASTTAAVAGTFLLAVPALADATSGQPGLGDPYYPRDGNTGYHADHYGLNLTFKPSTQDLTGTATIQATATQDLSEFFLDFRKPLSVASVSVNGSVAAVQQSADKLDIKPASALPDGQQFTVVVQYQGNPSAVRLPNPGTTNDQPWIPTGTDRTHPRAKPWIGAYSMSEPHSAAAWYPVNDHPTDKATYDISVTVPDGTQVQTGGVLTGSSSSQGMTTWTWHNGNPTASYLQSLTIGHYTLDSQPNDGGRPVSYAFDQTGAANVMAAAQADLERTPEVLAWESGLFGPYPFDAEGGVVVSSKPSDEDALEFETRPVYLSGSWASGTGTRTNMFVVVHENAHQWFGDSVSVGSWKDIWLNEGFATYSEWLWSEHVGKCTAANWADQYYNDSDIDWSHSASDPGVGNMLDENSVYFRGAMTLQALRNAIGDNTFFTILKTWAAQHRNGNGSTAQFIALADQVAGKPVDGVLNAWLTSTGQPTTDPGIPATGSCPQL